MPWSEHRSARGDGWFLNSPSIGTWSQPWWIRLGEICAWPFLFFQATQTGFCCCCWGKLRQFAMDFSAKDCWFFKDLRSNIGSESKSALLQLYFCSTLVQVLDCNFGSIFKSHASNLWLFGLLWREWLISKWRWQERRWSSSKKSKEEKKETTLPSSSQPHAGDNCLSQN